VDPALAVAALPNAVTAYLALTGAAHLQQGERVLVHGASGGVGHLLVQMAVQDEVRNLIIVGSGPAGMAATMRRTPLVLTEADSHLGLANRLLAGSAKRVCLAFPIAGRDGERYLVTGRPVPDAVLHADRAQARRRFHIDGDARCLLVMGGSQGARSINQAAIEAFAEAGSGALDAEFRRDFHVIHLSGRRDHEELERRLAAAAHAEDYTLLPYEPDLGDVLAACDLVLARSGGSIFEVVAAGRPAILVPYPYATADHQAANAAWMSEAGAAETVADEALGASLLAGHVSSLLEDERRLAEMSTASAALAKPDAARKIADEVLAAAHASASGAPYAAIDHKRRTGT